MRSRLEAGGTSNIAVDRLFLHSEKLGDLGDTVSGGRRGRTSSE